MNPLAFRGGEPADVLIRGAHAVDPREGLDRPLDVLVRSGEIAGLAEPGSAAAPEGTEVIEAAGRHLFPAFVDPHVHLRTPGQEHKEDLESGTRAAAAGGYGAVVAMPNTTPAVDSPSTLRALIDDARERAVVPTGFLAAVTRGLEGRELTEMAELREIGALGFTDDGRPVANAGVLRRALQYQRLCGGVIALHEEDPTLSGAGVMHEGEVSARLGLAGIPTIAESTMIARDAAIAAYECGRIHVQHVTCAVAVDAVRAAKAAGVQVTAEASPHHLLLTDEAVARTLDTRFKMNPPLRPESDRQAVIAGLLDGTLDCIATDHAPHAAHEKEVPFEEAAMGTTGLETAFAAVYSGLVQPGILGLGVLVQRLTAGAEAVGLPMPRIAAGAPGNLTLVNLDAAWHVGEAGYASRAENSAFAGETLSGVVLLTLAAGTVAHRAPVPSGAAA
ncbi:MAG: dihydroorotase [Solirubrobacteraceae bacterium]